MNIFICLQSIRKTQQKIENKNKNKIVNNRGRNRIEFIRIRQSDPIFGSDRIIRMNFVRIRIGFGLQPSDFESEFIRNLKKNNSFYRTTKQTKHEDKDVRFGFAPFLFTVKLSSF